MCVEVYVIRLICEIVSTVNISMCVNVCMGKFLCKNKRVFDCVGLGRWVEESSTPRHQSLVKSVKISLKSELTKDQ